jgi:hypothetical protein
MPRFSWGSSLFYERNNFKTLYHVYWHRKFECRCQWYMGLVATKRPCFNSYKSQAIINSLQPMQISNIPQIVLKVNVVSFSEKFKDPGLLMSRGFMFSTHSTTVNCSNGFVDSSSDLKQRRESSKGDSGQHARSLESQRLCSNPYKSSIWLFC